METIKVSPQSYKRMVRKLERNGYVIRYGELSDLIENAPLKIKLLNFIVEEENINKNFDLYKMCVMKIDNGFTLKPDYFGGKDIVRVESY